MHEVPEKYIDAINTYQPVNFEGIKLYPICVREHQLFENARPAIDFLQQSLPVRFISIPLLSAYYKMDLEAINGEGGEAVGLFVRAVLFLILATRFKPELSMEERLNAFWTGVRVDPRDETVLKCIAFEQDGVVHEVTPLMFSRLRPVLAAQNGIELHSDDENPELVEAERQLAEINGPDLDYDVHTMISSVAAFSNVDEADLYDWPILKLNRRRDAFVRLCGYIVCGIAESNGAKFKGGNPVPSPIFDRKQRGGGGAVPMGDTVFAGKKISAGSAPPIPEAAT